MQKKKNRNLSYVVFSIIIPLLMIGLVYLKMSVLIALAITLLYFFFLNRYELSAVLMLAFPPIVGVVNNVTNISLPASVVLFVLVAIVLNIQLIKLFNKKMLRTFVFTTLVLLLFLVSALIGGLTASSINKLIGTVQIALSSLVGFAILFTYPKINMSKLAISFLLIACLYLGISYGLLSYPTPTSLWDFSSFRAYSTELKHLDLFSISYHRLGYCGVLFIAYMLLTIRNSLSLFHIILSIAAIWITLFSGARQAILAIVLVIAGWYLLKSRTGLMKKMIPMSLLLVVSFFVISSLEVFQDLEDRSSGASGAAMNRNYDYPLKVISQEPLAGVGFGNYYDPYGERLYAHNIVLEILSETGFGGMFIILCILFFFYMSLPIKQRTLVLKDRMGLILILPYAIRCFVSGGLQTNVQVFVLIFAYFSFSGYHIINGGNTISKLR